jgi:polyisoprenoid-binding protein YceI
MPNLLPTPGTWKIDPSHTTAGFVARHLMVTKVRGRFASLQGAIEITEDPTQSTVEITIDTPSVDTRDEKRDEHLRSPDFFDVEKFPYITFKSSKVEQHGGDWKVSGDLTIKDVTRPVVLDVEYEGTVTDPWGGERIGFTASTEVDREDWGLTWNVPLEAGGVLVSRKVKLELEVEAVKS